MKFFRLIEMFLKEYLSDMFHIQTSVRQGDDLSPLISNFDSEYAVTKV
jgi:hypothetical protein